MARLAMNLINMQDQAVAGRMDEWRSSLAARYSIGCFRVYDLERWTVVSHSAVVV
jgi:hypothetical protein